MTDRNFEQELQFSTSRSSGPGGQNVNKVNTRVELRFNVPASKILTDEEKARVMEKLAGKITTEGDLIISSQESRSQGANREIAYEKFLFIIEEALKVPKKRKRTHPTKAARQKRLEEKQKQSQKKNLRKPPEV
ncbi:MAG: alternative ribosome rescue aminoacyl-tRNA hydrolase ArfB [Bacteroidales bacterium]